jgi:hypothetical protein
VILASGFTDVGPKKLSHSQDLSTLPTMLRAQGRYQITCPIVGRLSSEEQRVADG